MHHASMENLSARFDNVASKALGQAVKVALQEDGGGGLVHFFFPLGAADVGGDQEAVGLGGGEPFVPGADGNGDGCAQGVKEFVHFGGGGPVGAIHVARHANHDKFDFFFLDDFREARQEIGQGMGRDKEIELIVVGMPRN